MNSPLLRSATFAGCAALSLAVTISVWGTVGAFLGVAAVATLLPDGPVFDALATPGDVTDGRLRTLAGFGLVGGALASLVATIDLPAVAFVTAMMTVGFGDLGRQMVTRWRSAPVLETAGFVFVGGTAAVLGQGLIGLLSEGAISWPTVVFLATSAAVLGALLRSVLFTRTDPLVLGFLTVFLWLLANLGTEIEPTVVVLGLGLSFLFGWLSIRLETASLPGMLTGVLLSLVTVVLGGLGWFVVLLAFFGIGGLSTKFHYERKVDRGVAEPNEGARGTGNVLGNSLFALLAVLAYAAHLSLPFPAAVYAVAFAGSLATALADTLSSEIGGLFDRPRLLTTLERVEPGTDGAVTWQGELAGLTGAVVIGVLSGAFLGLPWAAVPLVTLAGLVGMTVDSLAGATIEGIYVGNQSVNFLATTAGGMTGALLGLLL